MRRSFGRADFSLLLFSIKAHFSERWLRYLIAGGCAVAGIIVGCVNVSRLAHYMSVAEIKYFGVIRLLGVNVRFGTVFWNRLLITAGSFGVIILFSCHFTLLPGGYLFLVYRGYVLGLNAALWISIYGMGGLLNALIFIIPHQLILTCGCTVLLAFCQTRCLSGRRGAFAACDYRWLLPRAGAVCGVMAVLWLLEAIITPFFSFLIV